MRMLVSKSVLSEIQRIDMQDVDSVLELMQVSLTRLHHLSRPHHPPPLLLTSLGEERGHLSQEQLSRL